MGQKGKVTKTEIFCLLLSAAFVLLAVLLFAAGSDRSGGWEITAWKDKEIHDTLPQKIDINTADESRLQQLPGIGPVLAQRIIAWREENGNYEIPEDLLAVEGIGLTTLDGIRDLITIQEGP